MELIWKEFGQAQVDLFVSRETSHCPLWFSLTHPAPLGLDAMTQTWPRLRLCMHFPRLLCSREYWRVFAGTGSHYFLLPHGGRAEYGSQIYYPFSTGLLWTGLLLLPPSVPSGGLDISPPSRTMETVGLASEGAQLIDSGLSTEVFETILHSRAPSTRKRYALKWKVFTSWCSDHQLDPVNCPVGTVLESLQDRFTAGQTPSTLKVYVAAISAYHIPLGGMSMGKDPLVSRFLCGTLRLRPAACTRVPTWDLAIVLQGFSLAPFKPLKEVPAKLKSVVPPCYLMS